MELLPPLVVDASAVRGLASSSRPASVTTVVAASVAALGAHVFDTAPDLAQPRTEGEVREGPARASAVLAEVGLPIAPADALDDDGGTWGSVRMPKRRWA